MFADRHVTLSIWAKTVDVRDGATIELAVTSADNRSLATAEVPIRGTTGWQQYNLAIDVPRQAVGLTVATKLRGAGEFWVHDFSMAATSIAEPSSQQSSTTAGPAVQ